MNIWRKVIDDIDEIYFLKKDNQNKIKNYFPQFFTFKQKTTGGNPDMDSWPGFILLLILYFVLSIPFLIFFKMG